jgi:hypothetical protein
VNDLPNHSALPDPPVFLSTRERMNCRTISRLLFVAVLLTGHIGWAQKISGSVPHPYPWGSVSVVNDGKGLSISVTVQYQPGGPAAQAPATAIQSVNAVRTVSVEPAFPHYQFYVAIPPNVNVSIKNPVVQSLNVNPADQILTDGYTASNDSSIISSRYVRASEIAQKASGPILRVDGYEWFRGYRLARIDVAPYQQNGTILNFAHNIEASLSFEPAEGTRPVLGKRVDPQFQDVLKHIVANANDLASLDQTSLALNDTTGGWIPWGASALKLGIGQDAIYRLTYQDLQALITGAGLIDPTTFRLFNRGTEIPIYVAGEQDHNFGAGDYIEFPGTRNYGLQDYRSIPSGNQEYPEYLNRYTDTSIYWLTWGAAQGLRTDSTSLIATSADSLTWYTELVHVEKNNQLQFADGNNLVVRQDPRWTSGDIWGWDWLYAGGVFNVPFTASNVNTAYPTARIYARCASGTWPLATPSYRVRLRLNSSDTLQKIDDSGSTPQILMEADAPISNVVNGPNTIHVYSLSTPSSVNAIWFDWAEAEYPRNLVVSGDTLVFGFPWITSIAPRTVVLSGIISPDVVVYKYAPAPKRITNILFQGSSPYTISFADTVAPGDRYMLCSSAQVKTPAILGVKTFQNLRDPSRGADYVLITSSQFLSMAQSYAAMIGTADSLRTAVIDVTDIFDEFGYGYPTAESIRDFLKATSLWQPPMPSYVFIVGNGTYDYKHFVSNPNIQYHPINAVPTYGEPVSDPWLAVLNDSSIVPQMYIGRIPANTTDEFSRYTQHVESYLNARNDDWNKHYMFFAGGDPGEAGQIASFRQTNESIISSMVQPAPIGGVAYDFYKTTNPSTNFGPYTPDQFNSAVENGAVLINYIGHSGTETWDNGISSVTQLQNTRGRYALMSDFGCSTGKFAEPDIQCFGSLFTLDPAGSAIAYVGNTALGFVSIAATLPPLFYKQFFVNQIYEIGKAHLLGKIEAMNQLGGPTSLLNRVMMLTNSLLGDPALRLAIPQKPNLAVASGNISISPPDPSDEEDSLRLIVPYVNSGRVVQDSFKIDFRSAYNNLTADSILWRKVPLFLDTMLMSLPIKNSPGEHDITIQLNPDNHLSELQVDDNTATFSAVVVSTSLRPVRPQTGFESPASSFLILNPFARVASAQPSIVFELDTTNTYTTSYTTTQPLGRVVTSIPLPTLTPHRRYYWRAGIANSNTPKSVGSFSVSADTQTRWRPADSTSWKSFAYSGATYFKNAGVQIANKLTYLSVTSAGGVDGSYGAVDLNGIDVLANTYARGHTVVLLDTTNLSVKDIRTYDTYGFAAQADSLGAYLAALPAGSLVIDLIIDEGAYNLSSATKAAIKSIGSALIDSVQFRDSWAIIGRKGAFPGSVPEEWRKSYTGRVTIDTIFSRKVSQGTVTSTDIGPVGAWKTLAVSGSTPSGSSISIDVLGVHSAGLVDTLLRNQATPTIDLSTFSALEYSTMRLAAFLNASPTGQSPTLTDWNITVEQPAELAVNYQSVSLSADSVFEGSDAAIQADVYNVGSLPADSVFVRLTSIGAYGVQRLDSVLLGTIGASQDKSANFTFHTTGKRGSNTLLIEVDPEQRINELYKSNNVMTLPLYVRSDTAHPTFTISVDGSPVYDGDYVSTNPTITVDVFDNSPLPITDPTSVVLMLDNQPVTLGTTPDSLFESRSGPDKALVTYRPRLQKGEHTLSVQVKDASGNFADTTARQVTFKVETEPGLLNVYNYPNPFAHQTQFTFNLVGSQLPDNLKIKIYSIAGRLIQELTVWRGDLRIGFNRVPWDGRDRDGDELANGVYFYKVVMSVNGKTEEVIQKLAIVK